MTEKIDIIKKIYYDPAGYSSKKVTLEDSKKIDKSIKMKDIDDFFNKYVEQKTKHHGQNSFVAPEAYYEYEVDLFFINDLEEQKFTVGLLCIDIFSKWMEVIPIKTKDEGDVASGLLEAFNKMGQSPKVLYSDNETSMSSRSLQKYFKDNDILHIATRGSASVAEVSIKTFKNMLYKRIGDDKDKQWTEFVYPIILTYNNKLIHSSTKMTPAEARKKENSLDVKLNLESIAKHGRKYGEIKVNDLVKIFKKKKKGMKAQQSYWSEDKHKIISIEESHGMRFYKVANERPLLRHEILKI